MNRSKKSLAARRFISRFGWLVFAVMALASGCRTFDYTDKDLEQERKQLKQGGDRGLFNSPNGF